VAGSPDLGVLRRLRHDPTPTAGVAPARRTTGCRAVRATSGRFPRSLMSVQRDRYPASPRRHRPNRRSQCWSGPPAAHRIRATGEKQPSRTAAPAPQHGPSTRVGGPLTPHGASSTGSVALHLSVFASGHESSGGTDPPLRCQGCSQPWLQPEPRPALSFGQLLRQPAAEPFHLRTVHQRLVAHTRSSR
jgi:hypothetical protein